MNKRFCMVAVAVTLAVLWVTAWAATPPAGLQLAPDGKGGYVAVQGIAPKYRKDVALTGASQTIDVTNDTAWYVNLTADAKFRTMSSATKSGIQHTLHDGQGEVIDHSSTSKTFLNLSGASGTLRRQ